MEHSPPAVSLDLPLQISLEWLIRFLVLGSMLLQLFLVVCGAFRYRSSSGFLRLVVWLAYLSADAVAISTLGIMMHSVSNKIGSEIYGVWGCLLLLHLGGPDTITAYSTADNELWLRHGFVMIYQVSIAVYVIYVSTLQGFALGAAVLLFVAGFTKYAERTASLRFGSFSQIVNSTQPIYKFMQYEDKIDEETNSVEYNYLVMGEEHLYQNLKLKLGTGSADTPSWKSLLEPGETVTIKDVWFHEGLQPTDNYILCLSHALFKMYKRRFVGLFFHEGVRPKTRNFFLQTRLPCETIFRIVEMELKFMYDILFSKSSNTAFSSYGTLLRFVNTSLVVAACFLLFYGWRSNRTQETVTYVVICVAILVEIVQLCRIAISDWTMVRLVCANIQHFNGPPTHCSRYSLKLIRCAISFLGKIRKRSCHRYWSKKIQQYSVIDVCLSSCPRVWKMVEWIPMLRKSIVPWYIKARYIEENLIQKDFQSFIFQKLKVKCSPQQEIEICRGRVYGFDECLLTPEWQDLHWASQLELEELILTWHIASTICERDEGHDARSNLPPNVRFSRTISRYCAYLLVSRANLLPVHADIARITYIDVHYEIVNSDKNILLKDYESKTAFGLGAKLARTLMEKVAEERWAILAEYWAGFLIYIAVYNKATLHAECLAGGGEFLSQLWVLLGHMGCGEQSESAVTKKREEKSVKEKEEEEKRKKKDDDTSREEEKKWRREEMKSKRRGEEQSSKKEEKMLDLERGQLSWLLEV